MTYVERAFLQINESKRIKGADSIDFCACYTVDIYQNFCSGILMRFKQVGVAKGGMRALKAVVLLTIALMCHFSLAADSDTEGVVSKIVTMPVVNGKHIVRIYFSSYISDRWGCLQNQGYIEANDATTTLDGKGLDRLLALAATAFATGKMLGIDSPGTNPCTDANMFWLIQ
jgi:hypothetical protein